MGSCRRMEGIAGAFSNGLKSVYEYAAAKNLKMGMWLEIEVMGTSVNWHPSFRMTGLFAHTESGESIISGIYSISEIRR